MNNKIDQRPILITQTFTSLRLYWHFEIGRNKTAEFNFFRQDFYIILSSLYSVLMMDFYHSYYLVYVRPDGFFFQWFLSVKKFAHFVMSNQILDRYCLKFLIMNEQNKANNPS